MKYNKDLSDKSVFQYTKPVLIALLAFYGAFSILKLGCEKSQDVRMEVGFRNRTKNEERIEYLTNQLEKYGRVVNDEFWPNGAGGEVKIESILLLGAEDSCVLPFGVAEIITLSDEIDVQMTLNHTDELKDILRGRGTYLFDVGDWELLEHGQTDTGMKSTLLLYGIPLYEGYNHLEFLVRQADDGWAQSEPFTFLRASDPEYAVGCVTSAYWAERVPPRPQTSQDKIQFDNLVKSVKSLFE